MKRILLLLTFFSLIGGELLAQAPQGFQYQAVARTDSGKLIAKSMISVRISIQDGAGGNASVFYKEDHNDILTNSYGLFSLVIGEGSQESAKNFDQIDWASDTAEMHIKIEVDQDGGSDNNFVPIGDPVQLRSVPYALFALETAESPTLSITGNALSISSGNSVTLPQTPAGTIMMFGGPAANIPSGWLKCDGQSYNSSQFQELFAAIGTTWGGNGSDFNVPDMRGRFTRGWDEGEGNDPDAAIRLATNAGGNTGDAVGSLQEDAFQGHFHEIRVSSTANSTNNNHVAWGTNTPSSNDPVQGPTEMFLPGGGSYGVPKLSSETRPQNVSVIYIIKT